MSAISWTASKRRSCERRELMNCCGRLNQATSDYFVQMADAEWGKMWNARTLNEERIESFCC